MNLCPVCGFTKDGQLHLDYCRESPLRQALEQRARSQTFESAGFIGDGVVTFTVPEPVNFDDDPAWKPLSACPDCGHDVDHDGDYSPTSAQTHVCPSCPKCQSETFALLG